MITGMKSPPFTTSTYSPKFEMPCSTREDHAFSYYSCSLFFHFILLSFSLSFCSLRGWSGALSLSSPYLTPKIDKIAHVVGGDAIARGCARVLGIQDLIEEWKPARTSTKCDRDRGPPARGPDISHGCAMVGYTDHSTHSRFTLTPLRKWPLGMDIVGRFIVSKSGHVSYGDRHGYEDWVL